MSRLICTRGLPGSGKSTWAQAVESDSEGDWLVTSRDALRTEVFGLEGRGVLSPEQENAVTRIQREIVRSALAAGRPVIVDNTHLRAKYLNEWARLASELGARFSVRNFDTPLEVCIERDRNREHPVGEDVIRALAKKFPAKNWPVIEYPQPTYRDLPKYEPGLGLPPAYVFDIDGTLADHGDRDPYDASRALDDTVHEHVRTLLYAVMQAGYRVLFLSGRSEDHRAVTEAWLRQNILSPVELYMRGSKDGRQDWIVKHELFMDHVAPFYRVVGVVDDRLQVARMWHAIGVPLFRVGDPDADF